MNPTSTILVVDDEPKALVLLQRLLGPEGYRVVCTGEGSAVLPLALRETPDVILLDIMMPGVDGYTVCQQLRAEPQLATVPILLLTALDDRDSRLKGLSAGADDFITKPFDSAELRVRLRTITRLNRYRRLHEESSRFEAALAHSQEGIVLTELDGALLTRNAAFERLLSPAEPARENFFDYLESADAALLQAELAAPQAPRPARECRLRLARNPETIVEIVHGLVPWERRTIAQFHLRDVTEKKSLEAQLLRSQRIELLGQVSGSIVHDVNNVLSAIHSSVELMRLDLPPEADGRHLTLIGTAVKRGSDMLRQLLMFARGSDGPLTELDPVPVLEEVVSLVRDAVGNWYPVQLEIAPDLPAIRADSTQLHQIVMNLCLNARDAMPDGGAITVQLAQKTVAREDLMAAAATGTPGPFVTLSVRDEGTGMPPEVRARLFDPFFTTKPPGKGTGLGLATVLRLMRRHGGFVTVDTELGRGTCFTCHFPADLDSGPPVC